jgi:hypothetical protein
MKAIEINGEIKLFNVLPKNWSDDNGSHFNIGDGSEFGFKNVIISDYDERIQEIVNLHLEGDIYTYDVIEKPIKETLTTLKKLKVLELKNLVANKLSLTDWYIVREADSGEPTPQSIKDERAALRTQSNDKEAEINALTTKKEVVLFDINI